MFWSQAAVKQLFLCCALTSMALTSDSLKKVTQGKGKA